MAVRIMFFMIGFMIGFMVCADLAWAQDTDTKSDPSFPNAVLPDLPLFTGEVTLTDSMPKRLVEPTAPPAPFQTGSHSILTKFPAPQSDIVGRPKRLYSQPVQCTCCDQSCDFAPDGIISRSGILTSFADYTHSLGDSELQQQQGTYRIGDWTSEPSQVHSNPDRQIGAVGYWQQAEPANVHSGFGYSAQPTGSYQQVVENSTISIHPPNFIGNSGCYPANPSCRYVSFSASWTDAENFEDRFQVGNQLVDVTGTFRNGWSVGMAVGKFVRPKLRSEFEFNYRTNSGDRYRTVTGGGPVVSTVFDGRVESLSGMANFVYDSGCGNVRPYFGGGAGFAFVDADLAVGATQFLANESTFAYQAIIGFAIRTDPASEFFTEYRYFGTDDVALANSTSGRITPFRYSSHDLNFGMRFYR